MAESTKPDDDATLPTTNASILPRDGARGGDGERDMDVGARLGRYVLTERVGEGGMGVVWAARDPELDRIVAVKILRARAGNADGELRLRREGQTMARLAHPNVIRVYDVGVAHGAWFVAMEYVGGGTLHDWLERAPRTVDETLAVFALAGRGLAAAHDAGLVHRDFKPSNVLVGDDGRVLVTDFGLARPPSPSSDDSGSAASASPSASPSPDLAGGLLRTITRAGGVVGTPAFMAPEQHAGGPVDARADQFAFAVALWRALYRRPPFDGATLAELGETTAAGAIAAPPPGAKVPAHVRAALERALAAAPASRFPTMHALLAALADDPRRRRRQRVAAAAIVTAALGGAAAVWAFAPRGGDACRAQLDRFAGVWDADAARAVHDAFAATGVPYADASFREVARQLDGKRTAWEAMRLDSCQATRERREQSDAMMDARARCLEQRFADVAAFAGVLRHADAAAVRQAPQAAAAVGDVTACGDINALARRTPPPDDPVARGAIAALEHDLAGARAELVAGRYADVAKLTDALIARARAIAYPPVLSEALALAGEAAYHIDHSADGEKLLEEAELAAEAGGDDGLRFDCEVALVRVVGYALERDADAERHALRAEAMLTRLGADRRRTGTLAWSRSLSRWWNGHYAEARVQAQAAVDAFTQVDPAGVDLARALHMRAIIEQELHEPSASVATEERARAIGERALGAQHPLLGQMWNTAGGSLRRLGRFADAIAALQRGLDITDATEGADSSEAAAALMNIANVYLDEDRALDATPLLERGLAIWEKVYGPDHSRVADLLDNLGGAYSKIGRDADATAALTRAIAIHKAKLGPDSPATASSWKQLGYHQQRMHRYADARAAFTEAVRAIDASQGTHSPLAVAPLVGLGDVENLLGHRAAAAAAYARALALMPADEADLRAEVTAKLAAGRAP